MEFKDIIDKFIYRVSVSLNICKNEILIHYFGFYVIIVE